MLVKLWDKIKQFLRATIFHTLRLGWKTFAGTLRLGWLTFAGAVKLGYYTVIGTVKLGYYTAIGTVKLGYYTAVGTVKVGYFTVVNSVKLAVATVRQTFRLIRATIRLNIRLIKAELRRSRFQYVILLNLWRAPYLIMKLRYWADHPEKYSETQRFLLARRIVHYLSRTGHIKTVVTGRKYLPKEGGYVMFPNHQGKYDACSIIRSHPSPCTLVMDEKKSHTILMAQFLDAIGGKRLEIDNPRQTVKLFNEISQEIREGKRYIIFPEGGYENDNGNSMGVFKPGAFKAAIRAKVPIVPVALVDSYRAFNSAWLGPVTTQVHYLKPIPYEEYRKMKTSEIAELVQDRIRERIRIGSEKPVKKALRAAAKYM